ncbi:MAG: alpha/beta hydrolase [Desulfovibrionaceae bacterium]|nr:alpha/beta hydrolase [Desulfovibrionaceae bacterium]
MKTDLPGYTPGAEVVTLGGSRPQIDSIDGIVYAQILSRRAARPLHMNLLVPRTADRKPAIVYFPGGGFTSADHGKFIEMRMALASRGFVVAAAEYRPVPVTFPGLVQDGKAAVRFLREHADDYGIDPTRIGVLGDSAGGYLVQMLGTTNGVRSYDTGDFTSQSSDVQAVVTIYGISDLTCIGEGFAPEIQKIHTSYASTEALLVFGPAFGTSPGGSVTEDRARALAASPLGNMGPGKPPFLIMHGSSDTLVSPEQSAMLYRELVRNGNSAEYILVKGAGHGDLTWYQQPVIDRVVSWFARTLGEPVKSAPTDKGGNL